MKRELWTTIAMVTAVLLLAIGGPWLVKQVRDLPGPRSLAARADQRVVTLNVSGMTCSGCAAQIQSSLASVVGVSATSVQHRQERAYVVCDRSVADTTLLAAVHRAGPGFLAVVTKR